MVLTVQRYTLPLSFQAPQYNPPPQPIATYTAGGVPVQTQYIGGQPVTTTATPGAPVYASAPLDSPPSYENIQEKADHGDLF